MSDRLDRIENLLEAHGMAMADLRAKQEVTQLHLDRIDSAIERLTEQGIELNTKIDRTNSIVTELANIVYAVANRQQDHENRINRLEQD